MEFFAISIRRYLYCAKHSRSSARVSAEPSRAEVDEGSADDEAEVESSDISVVKEWSGAF